jgi:hypothetical protein
LWKRIPQSVKESFPDLENIWKVGRALWERNFAAAIEAIQTQTFPDEVAKIMQILKGKNLLASSSNTRPLRFDRGLVLLLTNLPLFTIFYFFK